MQSFRFARKWNCQTKRMKAEIMKYNAHLASLKEHVDISIQQLTFDEVINLSSKVYERLEMTKLLTEEKIPFRQKMCS